VIAVALQSDMAVGVGVGVPQRVSAYSASLVGEHPSSQPSNFDLGCVDGFAPMDLASDSSLHSHGQQRDAMKGTDSHYARLFPFIFSPNQNRVLVSKTLLEF
jgi:hypothetical protein